MIVAIERNKFTYLYKYNQIRVDINQVIDQPLHNLKGMLLSDFNEIVQIFNKSIPLFEQDHEIILLEVDKNNISFHSGILILFDSVKCIYPLTKTGAQLLEGKINDDFIVELPIFEKCVESLKITRSMEYRRSASQKLLSHFKLSELLNKEMLSAIEVSIKKNLLNKIKPQEFTSFLDHLIAYNKTPSFIPDGNIEYICKIGAIAIKYLGKPEEVFTNGPFYKSIVKYKSQINNKTYLASYFEFLLIADDDIKTSYEKMLELISKDYKGLEIFKVSYFFLAFRAFLNKNENNIDLLSSEIETLISEDKNTAAMVIAMIGYTFSFENIYEGLHKLFKAPLLKTTIWKKAAEIEKGKGEKAEIKLERDPVNNPPESAIENETIKENLEKIKKGSEAVETISDRPNENIEEPFITKPFETVAEHIVIYEENEPQTQDDNEIINMKDDKTQKEEQNINVEEELSDKSAERKLLTVQVFRTYLSTERSKTMQKMWDQFLNYYFPEKNEELSFEKLLDKLNTLPEEKKDKLLKVNNKKEESIKEFFDAYK
jgi:hypothetical protein